MREYAGFDSQGRKSRDGGEEAEGYSDAVHAMAVTQGEAITMTGWFATVYALTRDLKGQGTTGV